ncbi:unnamed protein product, partial [Musa acuminata subsp. burmannicoides]
SPTTCSLTGHASEEHLWFARFCNYQRSFLSIGKKRSKSNMDPSKQHYQRFAITYNICPLKF